MSSEMYRQERLESNPCNSIVATLLVSVGIIAAAMLILNVGL
jgi:hypothetical protein